MELKVTFQYVSVTTFSNLFQVYDHIQFLNIQYYMTPWLLVSIYQLQFQVLTLTCFFFIYFVETKVSHKIFASYLKMIPKTAELFKIFERQEN